jgi:transposase InsO family protein
VLLQQHRADESDDGRVVGKMPMTLERRLISLLSRSNGAWCGDITYVRTWEGWAYLATVIDLATRRVIG